MENVFWWNRADFYFHDISFWVLVKNAAQIQPIKRSGTIFSCSQNIFRIYDSSIMSNKLFLVHDYSTCANIFLKMKPYFGHSFYWVVIKCINSLMTRIYKFMRALWREKRRESNIFACLLAYTDKFIYLFIYWLKTEKININIKACTNLWNA